MLHKSTPEKEGIYKASKWQRFHVLCDEIELEALFQYMHECVVYPIGRVFKDNIQPVNQNKILENCKNLIYQMKNGHIDPSILELPFVITKDKNALYQYEPKEGRFLTQIAQPVIQWQAHRFRYSEMDGKIRSMIFGSDSVFWGFEFSFPSLFQDPHDGTISKVDKEFENFSLFVSLRKWIREYTRPTPFIIDGKVINHPIRLGKNCFNWIQSHPELKQSKIAIK